MENFTKESLAKLVSEITCEVLGNNLFIKLGQHPDTDRLYVQVGANRKCAYTGEWGTGWGGKAEVSLHSTHDEVVKKVLGLCLAYVEHEVREGFEYGGRKPFNPHVTIEALMEASEKRAART